MADRELKEYESKRKFEETPEPEGKLQPGGERLTFVVHKHAARSLHYDLRLEMEGVLKSWAVPKGPSLDPGSKRLAVMVEDHPLDYRDFEGLIPEGNYGAGSVIIWDRGFYHHPSAGSPEESERLLLEGLQKGDVKFVLEGEKLRGEFALVRTRKDDRSWLLLKKKDRYAAGEDVLKERESVVSRKTLEEIAETAPGASFRQERVKRIRVREVLEEEGLIIKPTEPMPRRVRPMLATLVKEPFDNPGWVFEVKWDGYRAIAEVRPGKASLYSRNLTVLNDRFAPVAADLSHFGFEAIFDGEIVVTDDQGLPDFQMLQNYGRTGRGHLVYQVFDLLFLEGHNLMALPLLKRKEILKAVVPTSAGVRVSDHVAGEGTLFFKVVKEKGLEGMVAKDGASPYTPGVRTRRWLKVKTVLTEEGVIAGFTEPGGRRKGFGALVLAAFREGELVFIGHTGGGFSARALTEIREKLEPLKRKKSPFRNEPATNTPVTWVKPEIVVEVAFRGWTGEGLMRQPVFLRLREDKSARETMAGAPEGHIDEE